MIRNILIAIAAGISGLLATSFVLEEVAIKRSDTVIEKPVSSVSIIIPSFNEAETIQKTVISLRNQSVVKEYPEMFEFILVDSSSSDGTVELAKPFVDIILIAGRGKLTARNMATEHAKGDIIVSVDSDSIYDQHALNALLKPFKDSAVVGTTGSTIDYGIPYVPGQIQTLIATRERILERPKQMVGRISAYRKDSFYKAGKFNEKINQLSLDSVIMEEEIGFGYRLSNIGDIRYVINAYCEHMGGLKIACRQKEASSGINECNILGIGVERF
jgi:glycosyltransferase involved in cell wall biosynthesis